MAKILNSALIPGKILGRNSGLTFVLSQKFKNLFFGHVAFLGGSRDSH